MDQNPGLTDPTQWAQPHPNGRIHSLYVWLKTSLVTQEYNNPSHVTGLLSFINMKAS